MLALSWKLVVSLYTFSNCPDMTPGYLPVIGLLDGELHQRFVQS